MEEIEELVEYFAARLGVDRDTILHSRKEIYYAARVVIINHFVEQGMPEPMLVKGLGLSQQVVNRAKNIYDYYHHRYLSIFYSKFLHEYLQTRNK